MTRRKPFQCLITESGCFEIISHKTNKKVGGSSGYIYYRYKKIIGTNGKTRYLKKGAHCFIYEQNYGPIPDGMVVRHRCDNPICINPAHLLVGTPRVTI